MNYLDLNNLANLCLGATLLGSGGGGDPGILYGQLHYLLEKRGSVRIIEPGELSSNTVIVPLALIGAPLVSIERIPNSAMFSALFDEVSRHYPGRELVFMPAEIGGCNALTPFMLAAQTSLPVLDADLIGRAFPKLQMCKPAVLGKGKQRSYLASPFGVCVSFETNCIDSLEAKARDLTVQLGGSAVIATFIFEGHEQEQYLIAGSLSRAQKLGLLLKAYSQDLSGLTQATGARALGAGILTHVSQVLENGFLMGSAEIQTENEIVEVYFQNEYLMAQFARQQKILAASPELIAILDAQSGLPLTSESLRYGLKVEVLALPPPDFWMEPFAYNQVNLQAFGLTTNKRCFNV